VPWRSAANRQGISHYIVVSLCPLCTHPVHLLLTIFLYRALEATCATYTSLNLSLFHYITVHYLFWCRQTGSGKTFTITGGAERYIDRGIIPRALSYVFDYYEKVILVWFSFTVDILLIGFHEMCSTYKVTLEKLSHNGGIVARVHGSNKLLHMSSATYMREVDFPPCRDTKPLN